MSIQFPKNTDHGDTLDLGNGLTAKAVLDYDNGIFGINPWDEHDGNAVIYRVGSGHTKAPNEIYLHKDRHGGIICDVVASIAKAKKEAWGLPNREGMTRKQIVAEAVNHNIEHWRGWLHDKWAYLTIGVEISLEDEELSSAYIGGVESNETDYIHELLNEKLEEALADVSASAVRVKSELEAKIAILDARN
jgi:hypothetical protein